MPGGPSSTTCAPTAPPRSPELILLFKAARRLEYLQENLRILGAPRGEEVETAYGLRWQSPDVRRRMPEPGEETLIVFTAQPYVRFTAARFARIVAAGRDETILRLKLELGSRARTPDVGAWQRFVLAGPNPSETSQVWVYRLEGDRSRGTRPPVEYADPARDEAAWRETIDRLAADDDYRSAVFLRVALVRPAKGEALAVRPPYKLQSERPYLVRIASHNPHLTAGDLESMRLVLFYDELATAVAASEGAGRLPADGLIDLLVEPIVPGPGWLELSAGRGDELLVAASLDWIAEPVSGDGRPAAAEEVGAGPGAPSEPLLAEREALALYAEGRFADAGGTLAAVPLDSLSPVARATLVAARLRQGRLPDPIERVRIADLSRPDVFRLVLDASESLGPADQLRLTEFVVDRLISHERAATWLAELVIRPLPGGVVGRLIALWADVDPDGAARARQRLER